MDQPSSAAEAAAVGFHTHTRQYRVAGMFAEVQEVVVLAEAEVGCILEECILAALTVDAVLDHIGFARMSFGLEEAMWPDEHIGFGKMRFELGVEMWLEGMR